VSTIYDFNINLTPLTSYSNYDLTYMVKLVTSISIPSKSNIVMKPALQIVKEFYNPKPEKGLLSFEIHDITNKISYIQIIVQVKQDETVEYLSYDIQNKFTIKQQDEQNKKEKEKEENNSGGKNGAVIAFIIIGSILFIVVGIFNTVESNSPTGFLIVRSTIFDLFLLFILLLFLLLSFLFTFFLFCSPLLLLFNFFIKGLTKVLIPSSIISSLLSIVF